MSRRSTRCLRTFLGTVILNSHLHAQTRRSKDDHFFYVVGRCGFKCRMNAPSQILPALLEKIRSRIIVCIRHFAGTTLNPRISCKGAEVFLCSLTAWMNLNGSMLSKSRPGSRSLGDVIFLHVVNMASVSPINVDPQFKPLRGERETIRISIFCTRAIMV